MVAGSPRVEWLDANEAELIQIEPVDEHINRTHRIVLGHVVVEQCGEQRALNAFAAVHAMIGEACRSASSDTFALRERRNVRFQTE
jgi:hypothetical protein